MRTFSLSTCALLALSITLISCEVGKSRKPEEVKSSNAVLPQFTFMQFGLSNWEALREVSSGFSGITWVAPEGSSFNNITKPPMGECRFSSEVNQLGFSPLRALNVGDLKLRGDEFPEVTLTKSDAPYYSFGLEPAMLKFGGNFVIETAGVQDRMKWSQTFKVPALGSNFKIRRSDSTQFTLPAPQYRPAEPNPQVGPWPVPPEDIAVLDKTQDFFLDYQTPEGTSYVRMIISDGSNDHRGSVTCFGDPKGPIWVPAGQLNFFKSTDQALMYIDFVSLSSKTDITNVNESLITSVTRHLHGRLDLSLKDRKQEIYFGVLILQ